MSTAPDPRRPDRDRDSAEWWDALSAHRLEVQACDACGRLRWPARAICNKCGDFNWTWVPASGYGTVASWTVTHRAFLPGLDPPFVVIVVRLVEQPDLLLPGSWDGARDGKDLKVGLPVEVGYLDVKPDLTLLSWRQSTEKEQW